jgi:hypothetical protein
VTSLISISADSFVRGDEFGRNHGAKKQRFRDAASNAKAKSILATLLFLPLVPAQKDRKVGRMVLILNMLKLENKLVACGSANKTV